MRQNVWRDADGQMILSVGRDNDRVTLVTYFGTGSVNVTLIPDTADAVIDAIREAVIAIREQEKSDET